MASSLSATRTCSRAVRSPIPHRHDSQWAHDLTPPLSPTAATIELGNQKQPATCGCREVRCELADLSFKQFQRDVLGFVATARLRERWIRHKRTHVRIMARPADGMGGRTVAPRSHLGPQTWQEASPRRRPAELSERNVVWLNRPRLGSATKPLHRHFMLGVGVVNPSVA